MDWTTDWTGGLLDCTEHSQKLCIYIVAWVHIMLMYMHLHVYNVLVMSTVHVHVHVPVMSSVHLCTCLLYTSPSPRDATLSRMPSSA